MAVSLKDEPALQPAKTFIDVWAAGYGARRFEDSTSKLTFFGDTFSARMDYDQSTRGFQGGIDVISITPSGNALMGGIFGGFLDSAVRPDAVAVSGDYHGGMIGAYASYLHGGFSLNAVVKADFLDFDWTAPTLALEADADVETFGGRIEVAYKRALTGST